MIDTDLRPGEIAVTLPEKFDAGALLHRADPHAVDAARRLPEEDARESDAVCTVEVDARWAAALTDIAACSHVLVLYWMHECAARPRACRCRGIFGRAARHLRAALAGAAEPGRRQRRAPPRGSTAPGCRSSGSTVSTARRWSISSPTLPRPTRCRRRWSGGARARKIEVRAARVAGPILAPRRGGDHMISRVLGWNSGGARKGGRITSESGLEIFGERGARIH